MKKGCAALFLLFWLLCSGSAWAGEFTELETGLVRWLKANRDPASGLPYSHVGDARFSGWTFTYDGAVTALAWLAVGEVSEARRIVDFYLRTPEVWRLGGVIEAVSFSGGQPVGRDWSVRSGANLWLGLAAGHLYRRTGEAAYLQLARRIADAALLLQEKRRDDPNYGGIAMGPPGDPANPKDQHFNYDPALPRYADSYATEINLDAYALFGLLAAEPGAEHYRQGQAEVLDWLKRQAFNAVEKRFNRGFGDATVATDVQSWGVSALGREVLGTFAPDAARAVLDYVEKHCQVSIPLDGKDWAEGVDFIHRAHAAALGRGPLISPEWTFQLANAWQRLSADAAARGKKEAASAFAEKRRHLLRQMAKLAVPVDNTLGFPYATLPDALLGHENRTPAAGNLSTVGVAYGLLALRGFDPLGDFSSSQKPDGD
ncbi:MAG: hypothetical protein RBT64_10860 [Trichloromonas sp.]|jgi:hypothetical protein|nr:hypothetical protein [Trichloromonas sp.]